MYSGEKWNDPEPRPAQAKDLLETPAKLTAEFSKLTDEPSLFRPPFLSESPKAVLRDFIVHIDSGSRNVASYPSRTSFRYDLEEPLRNIVCAELLSCYVPNITNTISQQYLLIDLGELNTYRAGVNQTPCFTVVYAAPRVHPIFPLVVTPSLNTNVVDGIIPFDKKVSERAPATYFPTRGSVNYINVSLRTRNGSLLNIGTDTDDTDLDNNEKCQWSMAIKFTCAVTPPQASYRFGT